MPGYQVIGGARKDFAEISWPLDGVRKNVREGYVVVDGVRKRWFGGGTGNLLFLTAESGANKVVDVYRINSDGTHTELYSDLAIPELEDVGTIYSIHIGSALGDEENLILGLGYQVIPSLHYGAVGRFTLGPSGLVRNGDWLYYTSQSAAVRAVRDLTPVALVEWGDALFSITESGNITLISGSGSASFDTSLYGVGGTARYENGNLFLVTGHFEYFRVYRIDITGSVWALVLLIEQTELNSGFPEAASMLDETTMLLYRYRTTTGVSEVWMIERLDGTPVATQLDSLSGTYAAAATG